jgi:hypothetical protein
MAVFSEMMTAAPIAAVTLPQTTVAGSCKVRLVDA